MRGTRAKTWPPPLFRLQHQPGETETTPVGFQQTGTNTNDGHNRNSRAKLNAYYTPAIMKKVKEIYWMDFALWDAVKQAEESEGRGVSGRHVGKILSSRV